MGAGLWPAPIYCISNNTKVNFSFTYIAVR